MGNRWHDGPFVRMSTALLSPDKLRRRIASLREKIWDPLRQFAHQVLESRPFSTGARGIGRDREEDLHPCRHSAPAGEGCKRTQSQGTRLLRERPSSRDHPCPRTKPPATNPASPLH